MTVPTATSLVNPLPLHDHGEGWRGRPLVSTFAGEESLIFLGAYRGQVADPVIEAQRGFDHGVGHPLLLLYDAKAPLGKNSNYFNGLGDDFSNHSIRLFYIIIKYTLFITI